MEVRINQLHGWFPRVHWEPRTGTPRDAQEYCKKEGKWRERGSMGTNSRRKGTEEWWQQKRDYILGKRTWKEIILDPAVAGIAARCRGWAKHVFHSKPPNFRPLDLRTDGYRYQARIDLFLRKIDPEDFGTRARRWLQF